MRIISNFHDYYDSVMSHGQDASRVFKRTYALLCEEKTHGSPRVCSNYAVFKPEISIKRVRNKKRDALFILIPFLVGFAGKSYWGIRLAQVDTTTSYTDNLIPNTDQFVYDIDRLDDLFKEKDIEWDKEKKMIDYPWRVRDRILRHQFVDYFSHQGDLRFESYFVENDLPILTIGHLGDTSTQFRVEQNKCLSDIQFYRVLDSFQAFQELDAFISGKLAQADGAMERISDKHLAMAKGFDCHSFRKSPTKNTPKKCTGKNKKQL